jgi:hypothetical protein
MEMIMKAEETITKIQREALRRPYEKAQEKYQASI